MCSCAYPCTDECGSDAKVGLVVKLIRGKVWIKNSITKANNMWARSPRLALSRRTLHYPKVIWTTVRVDVTTPTPYGHFFRKYQPSHTIWPLWSKWTHYRKVKLVDSLDKIKGSRGQLGPSSWSGFSALTIRSTPSKHLHRQTNAYYMKNNT